VIADEAAEKIKAAITETLAGESPVKAILDPYNPTGSSRFVSFTTSKELRWATHGPPPKCQLNWVICDQSWEAEVCKAAEEIDAVKAYVKNQNLGFEVPYTYLGETRRYLPDFILKIDDGKPDLLNLVVETKGFRGPDAQVKASTMRTYWVPGVNNLGRHGRWAFAEFTAFHDIKPGLEAIVEAARRGEAL
jgi:type III restriction enzyme